MTMPQTMAGYERTYRVPRSLREHLGPEVTAWDLFRLESDEQAGSWARSTLASLVASVEAETVSTLGCTECVDTGFYGMPDPDNPDLLTGLARRVDDGPYESFTADGSWLPGTPATVEVLDTETAAELAAALASGAAGLLRLYGQPIAFLAPSDCVTSEPIEQVISAGLAATPPDFSERIYALVHDVDQGAVMDLYRVQPGDRPQRLADGEWVPWTSSVLAGAGQLMVELDESQYREVTRQIMAAGFPKNQTCKYCAEPATKRIMHAEGRAYVPVCDEHVAKGTAAVGGENEVVSVDSITAGADALVADAPLTVSPDPRAEKLRRYWSSGRGAAKIRWLTPGDWKRCYRHLRKYMGIRARGYCQNLHKRNTGVWTGSRFNVGGNGHHRRGLFSSASPEVALLDALRSGRITGDTEGKPKMTDTLTDGVYTETEPDDKLLQAVTAGAIPTAPPDEWFADPGLTKHTTLTGTDEGRVFGHIAPWGVTHIGMAGDVTAPKNRTGNYAYFRTGQLVTASGQNVRVGQLTLGGGHAPMDANVASVVKHYDDTNSAVADVAVGEDKHGIWAAGALRPNVTPEQIRIMRASPPSGDWRRINGELELVAACHVNVQGFPIAASAYFAGGSVEALVAAGARQMAELLLSQRADAALINRIDRLEQLTASIAAEAPAAAEVGQVEVLEPAAEASTEEPEPSTEDLAKAQRVARVRTELEQAKRQALRDRVGKSTAGSGVQAGGKSTIAGTDSFPIGNVADLKKAIQAFGRAGDKPAARKHIISMAYKLKRPDLIPDGWRSSK
jgi:hypothetical protein